MMSAYASLGSGSKEEAAKMAAMATAISSLEGEITSRKTRLRNTRMGIGNANIITRQQFRDFIRTERQRALHCVTLPFTVTIWVLFSLVAWMHGNVTSVNRLRRSVDGTVMGIGVPLVLPDGTLGPLITLGTVTSVRDMWVWIADGLVPLLGGEPDRRGYLNNFNKVVGQVQLRQGRLSTGDCHDVGPDLAGYWRLGCRQDSLSTEPFGPDPVVDPRTNLTVRDAAFTPGSGLTFSSLPTADSSLGSYFFAFLDVMQPQEGRTRAYALAEAGWCDEATDWIEIHVSLFNGEVAAFTQVLLRFDFERGGLITSQLQVFPLHIQDWGAGVLVLDAVWMFMVLSLFVVTLQEVTDRKDHGRCGRCCGDPWMVLDWFGSAVGAALVIYFALLQVAIGRIAPELRPLSPLKPVLLPNATVGQQRSFSDALFAYQSGTVVLDEVLATAVALKTYHRLAMFWYAGFILVRFFRGFLGQPMIGSVGRSLGAALSDLSHLALILAVVFENFVLGGCILFGAEIKDWSSVSQGHRTALAFISGMGDFAAMYGLYPVTACAWLLSFAVAVIFISSNMVLAVLVDHYRDVKLDVGQGDRGVAEQSLEVFRDLVWTGSYHLRQLSRLLRQRVKRLRRILPELEPEMVRVRRVPYDEIIHVLEHTTDEKDESGLVPEWAKGLPYWAPMTMELLGACGCDPATAERLFEKCRDVVKDKRPDEFPADILYHEFEGQMKSTYDRMVSTEEVVRAWLADRSADCGNMAPRQKKLEQLALQKIMPRPEENQPMLMPGAPEEARPSPLSALLLSLEGPSSAPRALGPNM